MSQPFKIAPAYAGFLRRIGGLFFWIGLALFVLGIMFAFGSTDNPGPARALGTILASAGAGAFFFGFALRVAGEVLGVLFAIEENTRQTTGVLGDVARRLASKP